MLQSQGDPEAACPQDEFLGSHQLCPMAELCSQPQGTAPKMLQRWKGAEGLAEPKRGTNTAVPGAAPAFTAKTNRAVKKEKALSKKQDIWS